MQHLFLWLLIWLSYKALGIEKIEKKKEGLSLSPIVAANSTYGLMGGAAAVNYYQGSEYHKLLYFTVLTLQGRSFSLFAWESQGDFWDLGFWAYYSNFFDSYYHEQRSLYKEQPDRIDLVAERFEPYLAYKFNKQWSLRGLINTKHRRELGRLEKPNGETDYIYIYPNETTTTLGGMLLNDHRIEESKDFATRGYYFHILSYHLLDRSFTTISDQKTFTTYSVDMRKYFELTHLLNLSLRAAAGDSQGRPSYLYNFFLGGMTDLRGYRSARFRGQRFYEGQAELRYPIWRVFSGNTWIDIGDISQGEKFPGLLKTAGSGFKIALPPDYVAKLRFDFGFSPEGLNFSMYADHAF